MDKPLTSLKYLTATVFTLAFVFVLACGGSEKDASLNSDSADEIKATVVSELDDNSNGETSLTDIEPDTAVVTIDGERFEFEFGTPSGSTCFRISGVVGGAGREKDEADVRVDIEIPPKDYKDRLGYEIYTPEVTVQDNETGRLFMAGGNLEFLGPALEEGESMIDSYETNGIAAVGTATFMDLLALSRWRFNGDPRPEPVQGTFEINCG